MPEHSPERGDIDARLRRLLGAAEPGDDALLSDTDMRRVVEVLDSITPDDQFDSPPPRMWDAIAAGAGLTGGADAGDTGAGAAVGQPVTAERDDAGTEIAPVVPMRRPGPPPWWLGAAAAVFVVVIVAVGALAIMTGGDAEEQIAATQLDLLESSATGAATLVRSSSEDNLVLVVDVDGLDDIDGYYEVWLLTPEVDGLVSLGPLRSDGRYELPPGLDPQQFSVVDISIEPHDGDPTHSGNSVLRGGLTEA